MSVYLNRDAEYAAVRALGEDIGFGRIIQLAHQCWDEMLEARYGPMTVPHSESWTLASADIIRERRGPPAERGAGSPTNGSAGKEALDEPSPPSPKSEMK
jgi:hypothetical protein